MIESIEEILLSKHCKSLESNMTLKDSESEMEVELTDLPGKGLLITVPSTGKAHSGILGDIKGLKQSCDYLLLIENEKQIDTYFIELKETAGRLTLKKAAKQILYTEPVGDYLVLMAEVHFQKEISQGPPHFAVISTRYARLNKQGVKPSRPETFEYRDRTFKLIVSHSKISLNMLCPTP